MTILKWVSSYIIGVCAIEICTGGSGLLVTSGTHELNEFDSKDQRALSPDIVLKSSPLRVNRGPGEAIREQQSLGTRAVHQKQKFALTSTKLLSTTNVPPSEDLDEERGMNSADEDEQLSDDYQKEEEVSPTFSSTEIPKKKLVASVRPFRSQQDLVESLKRRRQMVQQQGYTSPPITSSSTESEGTQTRSTSSVRKYGNNTKKSPSYVATSDSGFEKKPKSFNRRYSTQSTPLIVEEVVTEESNIISQPGTRGGRAKPHAWRTRN